MHELEDALAKHFIQRTDAKAVQYTNGAYVPVTSNGNTSGERLPWTRADLTAHIAGDKSFGHYMVGTEDTAKLFAFDIDLTSKDRDKNPAGMWVGIEADGSWTEMEPRPCDPRAAWVHPKSPENLLRYLRTQLFSTAQTICLALDRLLPEVPVAVSYSGSKGLHVYGLTGSHPAEELKQIAKEILDATGKYELLRGDVFYQPKNRDPRTGEPNVAIEVFPKQGSLDGKDLGNLMRLPLGVNKKTGQRAHFISLSAAPDEPFVEVEPLAALGGNPWQK